MTDELSLETLLNRRVVDVDGRSLGRIEDVEVEERDGRWRVVAYHVGPAGWLQRLAGTSMARTVLGLFGANGRRTGVVVPHERMDLGDPHRPQVSCRANELPPGPR